MYGIVFHDYQWHIVRNGKMLKKCFWYRTDALRHCQSKRA